MRMSETPGKVRGVAPLMGEHTHEIARNLARLERRGDQEIGRRESAVLETLQNAKLKINNRKPNADRPQLSDFLIFTF